MIFSVVYIIRDTLHLGDTVFCEQNFKRFVSSKNLDLEGRLLHTVHIEEFVLVMSSAQSFRNLHHISADSFQSHQSVLAPAYTVQWNTFHPHVFLTASSDWTVRVWEHNTSCQVMGLTTEQQHDVYFLCDRRDDSAHLHHFTKFLISMLYYC